MHYTIRKARITDVPTVYDFICQLEETSFDYILFEAIYQQNLASQNCVYLIASEDNNDVVGFCSCHIQNLLHHCSKVAEIQELIVAEQCRGKGIGNLLLKEMEQQLIEKKCFLLEVTAQNKRTGTHQFYERHGFNNTHKKFTKELVLP